MQNFEPISRNYLLPLANIFLGSRWLNFWDILYYNAYLGQTSTPTQSMVFNLTSRQFSLLLYGLTSRQLLTPKQYDTGRKMLSDLALLAENAGLLSRHEEDTKGGYFNDRGIKAEYCFSLPSFSGSAIPLICKPNSYIELGWISSIGRGSYEQQLLNLFLWKPEIAAEGVDIKTLVGEFTNAYDIARHYLPPTLNPDKLPATLTRQLGQAVDSLQARHLIDKQGCFRFDSLNGPPHSIQPFRKNSVLEEQTQAVEMERLKSYISHDSLRGNRLLQLWEAGLVQPNEFKAAWTDLRDFYAQSDYDILLNTLQQRKQPTTQNRTLSWSQVVEAARNRRSKRGFRTDLWVNLIEKEPKRSRKNRPLTKQIGNLVFAPTASKLVHPLTLPLEPFIDRPQSLKRINLTVRADVPNWRRFVAQAEQRFSDEMQIRLRLLDQDYNLIFEHISNKIKPSESQTVWKLVLDREFITEWWRKKQPWQTLQVDDSPNLKMLFYLELEVVGNDAKDNSWAVLSTQFALY